MSTNPDYGNTGLYNVDLRNALKPKTSYGVIVDKARTSSKYTAVEIDGLFSLLGKALNDYYASFKVKEEEKFVYVPYFPKDVNESNLGKTFNYISYQLISREPPTSKSSGRKRVAPFVFNAGDDPEVPGYKLSKSVTWRDNLIKFTLQSTSYPIAEESAIWFETVFMPTYLGTFQAYGFNHIYFMERGQDTVEKVYNNLVYVRPLLYLVQTQTVSVKAHKALTQLVHRYEL